MSNQHYTLKKNEKRKVSHEISIHLIRYGMCFSCAMTISEHHQLERYVLICVMKLFVASSPSRKDACVCVHLCKILKNSSKIYQFIQLFSAEIFFLQVEAIPRNVFSNC